jgi:hypothetical protein
MQSFGPGLSGDYYLSDIPYNAEDQGSGVWTPSKSFNAAQTRSPSTLGLGRGVPRHMVPPASYCICRKPDDGSKMVNCTEKDCKIGWYHYNCLSKSQKLSTRGSQWICEFCQIEKASNTQQEPLVVESTPQFSKQDLVDLFQIPGPSMGVVDPYGLASIPPIGMVRPEGEQMDEDED